MSMIKKTINTDLSSLTGTVNSVFTGVDDLVNQYFDPYVTGYAFIYWVQLPAWFAEDEDLKYFKQMTQKNFRQFSGINEISLDTGTVQTGFAANEVNVPTKINRGNTDFSISHKEYSGGVMRKLYQKWITYIRDPRTGTAIYPKLFNVAYGARNHTGQLLYIVTRPDVTNTTSATKDGKENHIIEYACFYSNVFPTNIPLDSLYNFEIGSQDSPTIEVQFKGVPEIGPDVEAYAERVLRDKIISKSGDSFIPFIDSNNSNSEAAETMQNIWGNNAYKEIFGYSEK